MKLRKRSFLLLFVGISIFGILSVPPASGETNASTSTLNSGGVLRLRLGATRQWKFQPTPGSTTEEETQAISPGSGCSLTSSSLSGSLSKLTATNGSVGFVSDALGVRGPGEGTGQPCGRIDGNQTLTLELGSRFTSATVAPKRAMDFAEIDIEAKFSAKFQIAAWFGSTPVGSPVIYDTMGSDSGPDSGDLDNYRIRFPKTGKSLFTKLTFSVVSGGISLEGGSDGTRACSTAAGGECEATGSLGETIDGGSPTSDSLFHLVQYDTLLNCNDPAFAQGGGTDPLNSLVRKDNEAGADCVPIPVDLDASILGSEQLVSLRKDLLGQTPQFFWTVTWTPEDTTMPVKVTKFDFGAGYNDIKWCLADDGDADAFPELPPTDPQNPSGPKDPWCLTSQHSDLDASTGKVTVKEVYFGFGDPGAKR